MIYFVVLSGVLECFTYENHVTSYLGWHTDRSLHLQVLLLCSADQVCTHCGAKTSVRELHSRAAQGHYAPVWLRIVYVISGNQIIY